VRFLLVAALAAASPALGQDLGRPDPPRGDSGQPLAEHFHGGRTFTLTQMEADYSRRSGVDIGEWEGQGFAGNDINKFWWKTEGEFVGGTFEAAEFQALYSRNVWTFFDVQGGLRVDAAPDARGYAVVGVQGLMPYLLETELHAFVGFRGDVSFRLRQSFDVLLTNRFILQPLLETDLYATDVPERRVGSGFATIETGVQARYEVSRKFAPTVAIIYESKLGKTARLARADGEETGGWSVRGGVRFWF
jgi:copper resistance protein B